MVHSESGTLRDHGSENHLTAKYSVLEAGNYMGWKKQLSAHQRWGEQVCAKIIVELATKGDNTQCFVSVYCSSDLRGD